MEYEIIRSSRKTLALEIRNGIPIVRSPRWTTNNQIRAFVEQNEDWIRKRISTYEKTKSQAEKEGILDENSLRDLIRQAKEVIPERVNYYAEISGITYGKITIRAQHTKWGSCSSKGNLSFNCLLLLTPPEVLDSVVVHELCHRIEMNHSSRFYAEVLRLFPEYKNCSRWLKENGAVIMSRLPD